MKISFLGDFSDASVEGLVKISVKLQKALEKEGHSVLKNSKNAEWYHVHAGGVLLARKHLKIADRCYYSLYTNIGGSVKDSLINAFQRFVYFDWASDKFLPLAKRVFMKVVASCVPLSIIRHYLKRYKLVIVPTDYLAKKLGLKNVKVISFGVDSSVFKNKKLKHKFKAAYFGHVDVTRGTPEVVKAFNELPDVPCEIYLTKDSDIIKRKANFPVYGRVKKIEDFYNKVDVVVLPFRTETSSIGIPLVLLEAMACERAIITTNLPHIKEIVGDSAILINPYDAKAIVKSVRLLHENPKLRESLGKRARKRVLDKYNENLMAGSYAGVYKR